MKLSQHEHMPSVGAAMTPFPYTVPPDASIPELVEAMAEGDFRHLPVQREHELIGIVSIHDMDRLVLKGFSEANRWITEAQHVMTPDPYVVDQGESLATVLKEMIERRIGTTLVLRRGKLVGILTVTDVCRVLSEVLEDRYGSDSAA